MPVFVAFILSAVSVVANASTVYLVTTDIMKAQTQIDVNHSSIWTFTAGTGWALGGGYFVMKEGTKTASPSYLTLYDGPTATGTEIGVFTLSATDFCADHASNSADPLKDSCTSYGSVSYFYPSYGATPLVPLPLTAGNAYTLTLTSSTEDAGAYQYFIKGQDQAYFATDPKDPTSTKVDTTIASTVTGTPEPASWTLMLAAGCLACAWRRRRK